LVKIGPGQGTNGALLLLNSVALPIPAADSLGSHQVSSVVAVTSNDDVRSIANMMLCVYLRVEGVREAGSHVGYSQTEGVLKASGESVLLESTGHPVLGEGVGPDAVGGVISLVVVDHELLNAVTVQISVSDGVGGQNFGVNDSGVDKRAVGGRDTVEGNLLVKELSGKHNNLVPVGAVVDDLNTHIGAGGHNVLGPGGVGQALSGVLEPYKLATIGLRV